MVLAVLLWPWRSSFDPSRPLVTLAELIRPQLNLNFLGRLDMTFSDLSRPPVTLAYDLRWTHMNLADSYDISRPPMTLSILMEPQQPFCDLAALLWPQLSSCDLSRSRMTLVDLVWPQLNSYDLLWPQLSAFDLSWSHMTSVELIWPELTHMTSAFLLWPYLSSWNLSSPSVTSAVLLWPQLSSCDLIRSQLNSYCMTLLELIWPIVISPTFCDLSWSQLTSFQLVWP